MSSIVGVHGIAQEQLGRHLLRDPWSRALADGLERATRTRVPVPDLDMAFYGDVFLPALEVVEGTKRVGVGPVHAAATDGDGDDDPEAAAHAVLAELEKDDFPVVLDAAGEVLDPADLGGPEDPTKAFSRTPERVLRVMAAIDRRLGHRAGPLFVSELAQARRYLEDLDVKDAVDERVDEAVTGDCRVLIGHSLGSVVAVEHLRRHPERRVDLLLTLGSPLGLRAIRHLLPDPGFGTGPGGPPGVGRWVALRDPRDPVGLAGDLARWWPAVADDATVDNGRDAHAAVRYLSKRQTGAAVRVALPELVPMDRADDRG